VLLAPGDSAGSLAGAGYVGYTAIRVDQDLWRYRGNVQRSYDFESLQIYLRNLAVRSQGNQQPPAVTSWCGGSGCKSCKSASGKLIHDL